MAEVQKSTSFGEQTQVVPAITTAVFAPFRRQARRVAEMLGPLDEMPTSNWQLLDCGLINGKSANTEDVRLHSIEAGPQFITFATRGPLVDHIPWLTDARAGSKLGCCNEYLATRPMSFRTEETDLAELARGLEGAFSGRLPVGYLPGRTAFRDATTQLLGCSELEAEEIVDTMIALGFLHYEGAPDREIDDLRPWVIRPDVEAG